MAIDRGAGGSQGSGGCMIMVLAETGTELSLLEWLEGFGPSPWLLMVMLALSTFLSEDLACICGGILAATGWFSIWEAIGACAVGIWFGDMGLEKGWWPVTIVILIASLLAVNQWPQREYTN